jgi:hypothetical protein
MSGLLTPEIQFSSWNNKEIADPSGTRHLVSAAFAYDKLIGLGCGLAMPFNGLRLNLSTGEPFVGSNVAVVNASFPNFVEAAASGLGTLNNMRIWIPVGSGTVLDLPGSRLEFLVSGLWVPNLGFPSGAGQQFPNTLPLVANLFRADGFNGITGFDDNNVSQFIYMRLFLDVDFPIGEFGACGSGILRPRLTFDFF